MASLFSVPPPDEPTREELLERVALARSVLGHAPLYRAVRNALGALDGSSLEQLCAEREDVGGAPGGSAENLRYWHDGHDAGYAAALEATRRDGSAA